MIEFDFYRSVYGGSSLTAEEWPEYCRRAEAQLAKYKRTYTVTAPEKNSEAMAVCAMADSLSELAERMTAEYFTVAESEKKSKKKD